MDGPEIFFPHESVRKIQSDLVSDVISAVNSKENLIAHAPTGLGKTAAALSPALAYAVANKKAVFFLTSRHTQHLIAVDTLKEIKKRHSLSFVAVDMIGKKHMCPQPAVDLLYPNEFREYCKALVKDSKCNFYSKTKEKSKPTVLARKILDELKITSPMHIEELSEVCSNSELCPYEISCLLSKDASVVIADYSYIFNPDIRRNFFAKANLQLEDCIIIVDEGHNLPRRIRDQLTQKLSTFIMRRAILEAKKNGFNELIEPLQAINQVLVDIGSTLDEKKEKLVKRSEFITAIDSIKNYDGLMAELSFAADEIREKNKSSFIGSVALFLEHWRGMDDGFVRIMSLIETSKEPILSLSYRCLDPSVISREIICNAHSVIIMSGTLTPTSMFRDILGFDAVVEKEYPNPFPQKNRLNMIIPSTTTKYSARSKGQYHEIAKICAELVNDIPGNSILFFPSYHIRNEVNFFFKDICKKTTFTETPKLSKQEKQDLLESFKTYKDSGATMLAVDSGSFGEGIDLPGDYLKAVIVVGIPLSHPNLETQELIDYYDDRFNKGWDYGYLLPAITRSLQNAGRCIRSETDRGAAIFLDERYAWPNYKRCFPKDWQVITTKLYKERINKFFNQ